MEHFGCADSVLFNPRQFGGQKGQQSAPTSNLHQKEIIINWKLLMTHANKN